MAEFPDAIFTPRETENLPGLVYDADNKRNFFSEDFQNLGGEINAIETALGVGLENVPHVVARCTDLNGVDGGRATFYTVPEGYKLQIVDVVSRGTFTGTCDSSPLAELSNSESENVLQSNIDPLVEAGDETGYIYTNKWTIRGCNEVVRGSFDVGLRVYPGTFFGGEPTCPLEFDLIGYLIPI